MKKLTNGVVIEKNHLGEVVDIDLLLTHMDGWDEDDTDWGNCDSDDLGITTSQE